VPLSSGQEMKLKENNTLRLPGQDGHGRDPSEPKGGVLSFLTSV
jgi:hypothetical protein